MHRRLTWLTLPMACLAASSVVAADLGGQVRLPEKASIAVRIETSTLNSVGAYTPYTTRRTTQFTQAVTRLPVGYRVEQGEQQVTSGPALDPALAALSRAFENNAPLVYIAGTALQPVRIVQMTTGPGGAFQITGGNGVPFSVNSQLGAPQVVQDRLVTQNDSQFNWARTLAVVQGASLDLGKPSTARTSEPYQDDGMIQVEKSIELVSLDTQAGRAVIQTRAALDPAGAAEKLAHYIQAIKARPPVGVALPSEAEIARLKRANSTECRYILDTHTGLALESDCTTTDLSTGPPLLQVSTVTRTVITQTLSSAPQ